MSFKTLKKYLIDCIEKGKFPGCVCWVGNDKNTLFYESFGHAQIKPKKIKINKNTIFDLASLTKPIATALSIMILYEQYKLKLDDPIEKFLIEFKDKTNGKKTIKQLLIHTSGIQAWFPIYLLNKDEQLEFLTNTNTGKHEVIYSCLGYIILGLIIESIAGCKLNIFCYDNIFKKLSLKNTMFGPVKRKNIASTEFGNEHEKKMALKYGDPSKTQWRDYLIKGQVHDGNSFYAYDGVSGNAGLFSNVSDLVRLMRAYFAGKIIKKQTMKMMIKDYTKGTEQRGLGWLINPYPNLLSPNSFGHTGFTGTLLVCDPKSNLIIILLTNAVHPKVKLGIMPKVRKKVVKIISDIVN